MSLALLFAIIASILALSRIAVIYRGLKEEVRRGSIDPVPWMIWGALGVVTFIPQIVEVGWRSAMLFGAANLVVNTTVVWLARKQGVKFTRNDAITACVVVVGIVFWVISGNALFGLVFSLLADFVGVVRTWYKAWVDPDGERVMTWLFGASGAACAVASAVYGGEAIVLWYPVYAVGNALVSAAIVAMRRAVLRRRITKSGGVKK